MWALGLWVWEDGANTAERAREIVNEYLERDIPVSVVILDSPWSEEYNNFIFDKDLYPDPQAFIDEMHGKDVRVVLWVSSMINKFTRKSGGAQESELFREAAANGYLCGHGALTESEQGQGAFLDYTSPEAVAWWRAMMEPILAMGADGWKADPVVMQFPDGAPCSLGPVRKREYMDMFYADLFDATVSRNPGAAVLAQAVDVDSRMPGGLAPIGKTSAAWVDDPPADWSGNGLQETLGRMFRAARMGYAVAGPQSASCGAAGGTPENTPDTSLLVRRAQLSALSTFFSMGGCGERPIWDHGGEAARIFRYYAKWRYELIPYLYTLMVQAHRTGSKVMDPLPGEWQYLLGPDIFVAAMYDGAETRDVALPPGDEWIGAWTDEVWPGRTKIPDYPAPLDRYPVFIRRGAVIPMAVSDNTTGRGGAWSRGALTLDIYPEEGMDATLSVFDEALNETVVLAREKDDLLTVNATDTRQPLVLRVRYEHHPREIIVNGDVIQRTDDEQAFAAAPHAWRLAHNRLWVKTAALGDVQVECRFVK
jgi:alpha-glucosidase (family GH31 glycosyl hydrolase)